MKKNSNYCSNEGNQYVGQGRYVFVQTTENNQTPIKPYVKVLYIALTLKVMEKSIIIKRLVF